LAGDFHIQSRGTAEFARSGEFPLDEGVTLEQRIALLEANVGKAADLFPRESESQQAKLKYFDEMAQALSAYLKEVSPNGGLYSELQKSITATEARMRAYHDKSIDSNISAETQQKYRKLEERLLGAKDGLYRSKKILDAKRADLQRRLQDVNENRTLVADIFAIDDVVKSYDAISHASKNCMVVLQLIDSKPDQIIQRSE
jgi:hypothetical protein